MYTKLDLSQFKNITNPCSEIALEDTTKSDLSNEVSLYLEDWFNDFQKSLQSYVGLKYPAKSIKLDLNTIRFTTEPKRQITIEFDIRLIKKQKFKQVFEFFLKTLSTNEIKNKRTIKQNLYISFELPEKMNSFIENIEIESAITDIKIDKVFYHYIKMKPIK